MIHAPDLNTFQYISEHPGVIQGISVALNTLTLSFDYRNEHGGMLVHHFLDYLQGQPKFKELGYQRIDMLDGDPRDIRHHIIHPCKDRLEHAFHVHVVYSKKIMPDLIEVMLNSMEELQTHPELRASALQKNFLLRSIDAIAGINLYDPEVPLTFLAKKDREKLIKSFRSASNNGFLEVAVQTCPPSEQFAQYLHMNDFPRCEPNAPLTRLPAWQPSDVSSFQAAEQQLASMAHTIEKNQAAQNIMNNVETVALGVVLFGAALNWLNGGGAQHRRRDNQRPHQE